MIASEMFGWRENRYRRAVNLIEKCSFEGEKIRLNEVQKPMLRNMLVNQFSIDVREKKKGKTFGISLLAIAVLVEPCFKFTEMDVVSLGQATGNEIISDLGKIRRDTDFLADLMKFPEDNKTTIYCEQTGSKVRAFPPTLRSLQGIRPTILVLDEYSEWWKKENIGKELDLKLYREVILGAVRGERRKNRFTELKIVTNGGYQEGNCWNLVKMASSTVPLFRWNTCIENQDAVKFAIQEHFKLPWISDSVVAMSGDEHEISFANGENKLSFILEKDKRNNEVNLEVLTNKNKFNCFAEYRNEDIQVNVCNDNLTGWVVKYQTWKQTKYDTKEIQSLRNELGPVDFAIYHEAAFIPASEFKINPESVLNNVYEVSAYNPALPTFAGLDLAKKQHKSSLVPVQPRGDKFAVCGVFESKDDYETQSEMYLEKVKEMKIEGIVVDATQGEMFIDLNREKFAKYGCLLFPENFIHNRNRIFTSVKREVESVDENGKGNLIIPEDFNSLIMDLQNASPDEHMPDSVAALGMIINKMRSFAGVTASATIRGERRKIY